MEKNNIFDLKNTDGLSAELLDQLYSININDKRIMSLFKLSKELSIDEVIIGLLRKYGLITRRPYIVNRLYALHNKDFLYKDAGMYGVYRLKS